MKKFFGLSMACVMAISLFVFTSCDKDDPKEEKEDEEIVTTGFVDLGLTSGTKWKATNESDEFCTYDEAMKKYGKKIPDTVQCMELIRECKWTWEKEKGYKITGPNGKAIMLQNTGFSDCDNITYSVGTEGFYWTSKPLGPERAFRLGFNKDGANVKYITRCFHASVRLVE